MTILRQSQNVGDLCCSLLKVTVPLPVPPPSDYGGPLGPLAPPLGPGPLPVPAGSVVPFGQQEQQEGEGYGEEDGEVDLHDDKESKKLSSWFLFHVVS